jgi:hypothetical protein
MISGTPIRCPSGDDFTLGPLRPAAADLAIATGYPVVTAALGLRPGWRSPLTKWR